MTSAERQSQSYQVYWIIIDCIIMISTSYYVGISLDMKRAGEVTKNIFTLYFLQSQIIQRGLLDDLVRNSIQDLLRGSVARKSTEKKAQAEEGQAPPKALNALGAMLLAQSKPGPTALQK